MTLQAPWLRPGAAPIGWAVRSDWLQQCLAAERERWILWLPVALGAGIASYFALPGEPPLLAGLAIGTIALIGVAVSARDFRYLVCAVALAAAALGFAVAQWRTHAVAAPVIAKELRYRLIVGDIVSVEPNGERARVTLGVIAIAGLDTAQLPAKVRISAAAAQHAGVEPGQRVRVRATLRPPPAPALPGGFDFRRVAWFQRLGGVGFATGPFTVDAGGRGSRSMVAALGDFIQSTRLAIAARVTAALPGVPGAVAAALMVGERGDIPDDVRQAMQRSGLAHLLAISGLHVGLIAGFVFFAVRGVLAAWPSVSLRQPVKKWAALAALWAAGVYLLLAGATVPTQRAFIMTGLILLAVILDRRGISMRLVAWAATVVLLLRPEAILSVSFQMSFAAAIALVATYEVIGDRFRRALGDFGLRRRIAIYLASILLTTLVAQLATAPFAIFHFNQIATFSIVANLIAIPVAAFWVMPLIVVAFALMPFGLDGLVMPAIGGGIELIVVVAMWVSSWPAASLNVAAPPVTGLALMIVGGLWLCLWRTRWRLGGVAPIVAGLLTIAAANPPDILVSPDGKLTGIVGHDGVLLVSNARAQSFVRDQWLRRTGATAWRAYPQPGAGRVDGMRCDVVGCIYSDDQRTVAFVREADALPEDCRAADILIVRFSVPRGCNAPAVIVDGRALRRSGSHALTWPQGGGTAEISLSESQPAAQRRLWRGGATGQ